MIKYPTKIIQTSGGHYRQFKDTINIRNDNSYYAISNNIIDKKTNTTNRPSTLTLTEFKTNLPVGAIVKKITVEYNHRKIGVQNQSPSVSVDTKMNIPAPTISLVGVNGYSGKGQAPTNKWKHQTKTFKTNITREKINSKDFGVKINYPANTTKYTGYIGIRYVRLKIEYVTPKYGLNIKKAYGGYNKSKYITHIELSNKNKTTHNPTVSLTAPPGLTIYEVHVPSGTVNRKSSRSLDWVPKLKTSVSSLRMQVVFDTDVTYPSGQTSYTGDLVVSENYSNIIKHHTVKITDKPIDVEDDTDDSDSKSYTDDTRAPDITIKPVTVNEEFDYTFSIDDELWEVITHKIYDEGVRQGEWSGTYEEEYGNVLLNGHIVFSDLNGVHFSDYWNIGWFDEEQSQTLPVNTVKYVPLIEIKDDKSIYFRMKGVRAGIDIIHLNISIGNDIFEFNIVSPLLFNIRPEESSLSVPFHAILAPTEEETHRLGDGYSYTVQSYIQSSGLTEYYNKSTEQTLEIETDGNKTQLLSDSINDLATSFTLSCDFKVTSLEGAISLRSTEHYTENTDATDFKIVFGVDYERSQFIAGVHGSSEDYEWDDTLGGSPAVDTWYNLKIVRDGDTLEFYIDNNLFTTKTCFWFDEYDYYLVFNKVVTGSVIVKNTSIITGSGDTYVRDWYKNARIGVFNNRIEENCTTYTVWDSEETDGNQYRGIIIPAIYDITGKTLRITPDHDVWIDGHTLVDAYTHVDFTNLTDLNIPIDIALTHPSYSDTILTVELLDGNTVLWTRLYLVRANQPETLEPYEYTVDTTDYTNLTDEQILYNAEYWGNPPTTVNKYTNLECEFDYEKDYPLYIIIGGDYYEATNTAQITYTEPCIVESAVYTQQEPNGNFPSPIDDSIIGDGSVSELVIESQNTSNPFVFYDLDLDEDYGTGDDLAIRGIELTGEIEHSDDLIVYATLESPTHETGTRSIFLNTATSTEDNTNSFSIGGVGDLWGFNTQDLQDLNSWNVQLTVSNTLNDEQGTLNFGNVHLTFYIETIDQQAVQCLIDGENLAYYGAFITDVKIPAGLKTDTDFLNIDGTDTNDAYRQNIREKEITLELALDGCDLQTTTVMLQQITQLLVNEKDQYNRPIPKRIEFSHYPDLYWEYIIEETFETEIEVDSYTIKAKLTVPSGTAYNKNTTTTNTIGRVQGIASVNPIISLSPTEDTTLEIVENNSKQSFKMTYNEGEWNNKIVEIDCEDRIVWLKTDEDDTDPINITGGVDYNSNWFSLKGEYIFTSTNCTIRTVDYVERW